MKRFLALMCVSALVLGLSTGFDAEAKVKKARVKKIAKTERVAKSVDKDCDKAKAECKDAKACENKKAECKDAKACKGMKAEYKDAKACDKAQMKDNKKQLFGKNKAEKLNGDKMQLKEFKGKAECKGEKACDKAKADCNGCEKKAEDHKCSHQNPCCKEGACKKDASCGKEKCKANPEACCK